MQQPRRLLQARSCVEKVLREFDVTYHWINEHSLTVEVWVQQRRFQHTYPQTALHNPLPILTQPERNSLADLRRKLSMLNARPKESRMPSDPEEPPVPLAVPTPAEKPEPSALEGSKPSEPAADPLATVETRTVEAKIDTPSSIEQPPSRQLSDADARTLYQTTLLHAAEVISIELDRPLRAEIGDVLLIPLHDPRQLVSLPREQFRAFFRPIPKQTEPVAQAQPVSQSEAQPEVQKPTLAKEKVLEEDGQEPVVKASEPPENATVYPLPVAEKPALRPSEPSNKLVWSRPAQSRPASAPTATTAPATAQQPAVRPGSVRRDLIPLQVARLLHAVGYAQSQLNRPVKTSDIGRHVLSPHDRKQFAARMPGAVNRGWVIRHDPMPDIPGFLYGLSRHGRELLRQMGTRPWEGDGLPVPAWLQLATSAE